ncbi:MAG: Na+/H+ antiporter NhaC family protein [Niameybacter sp.]|uniref:Na+/H+ antiporter NhaC family protein n=1 Tax=Niameybacter sp. TaxID=2033640 RepID=UPI002FC89E89
MTKEPKKSNALALLPIGIFLILFLGTGIATQDFYRMPVLVAFLIAATVALLLNRKESMQTKIEIFCKGAGESNIILMCMIFLLAGAFSNVAKSMGAVESTVQLSLSILPTHLLVAGLFVIACFISISMGTSVGTITALTPIGLGIAQETGMPVALIIGAIIGGGMFGDNLSMISDTTIAAVRTQGCELKDKFKTNFFIVLPAAIITIIILIILTKGYQGSMQGVYQYSFIQVIPYIGVLVGALLGVNVFILLAGGTVFAGIIGMLNGSFDFFGFMQAAGNGMMGMEDLAMLSIVIGGTLALIKHNGGIDFLLNTIKKCIRSKKGAEFGIAALVSLVDLCTANNTIAIVMAGPLAKDIADEYDIDPKRTASLLDIFSSCWQGMIPYGAQILAAAGLAAVSPMELLPYIYYPMLMGICGLLAIAFGFPNFKRK